jgi:hypothetical protein
MKPDPLDRTVRIPIKIIDGRVEFLYGGSILDFVKDGSCGDLIIPAFAVKDKEKLKSLNSEKRIELLPTDTRLFVSMKLPERDCGDTAKKEYLEHIRKTYGAPEFHDLEVFADFIIKESLKIHLRGTKDAVLEPCKCKIEFLHDEARSVNHAYTLLSTEFETQRISHTGNVFQKVYYLNENKSWVSLDELRRDCEAEWMKKVFFKDKSEQ